MSEVRARLCACVSGIVPVESVTAEIIEAARAGGLHLLLAHRLRLPALADELRGAAVVEAAREHELRAVLAGLAGAGVRPILLKGEALARTHYPRPELRPRADVDLMIPEGSRDVVASALVTLGYRRQSEVDGSLTTGQYHFEKADPHGILPVLDVHWRVSNVLVVADVLTYQEIARDAVSVAALGPHAWSPSSVHALLVACVHRVAHHDDSDHLLWLFDVHLLGRALSADERVAFTRLASERQVRAICGKTLELAEAAFGGLDAGWIRSLADVAGAAEPSAALLGGALRRIDILKSDLEATDGWRLRLRLLREHLFPRPQFMYERYGTTLRTALPLLYVHRTLTGLPKWFRR
jgi:hypothetical protein